jgi:ATP-dependent DNA helicase RecG
MVNNYIEFDFTDDFFFTIFTSNSIDIKLMAAQEINNIPTKKLIIQNIQKKSNITIDELANIIGVSNSAIKKHLANFKKEGIIQRVGSTKAGHWEILDE